MLAFRLHRPICLPAGAALIACMVALSTHGAVAAPDPQPHHRAHGGPVAHAHALPRRAGIAHGVSHGVHPARRPPSPVQARPPAPVVPLAPVVPPEPPKGTNTGLPLPRFASLRADMVNLRGGPGTRYPIQWVYRRRDLPVEIEREFDVWRLVEDSDGVKGWVHQATLVGTRSFVVLGAAYADHAAADDGVPAGVSAGVPAGVVAPPGSRMMRRAPQSDAPVVAILKAGVIGRIRACAAGSGWCRVSVEGYSGWLPRQAFWGLLPDETILPP